MKKWVLILILIMLLSYMPCLSENVISPGNDFYYYDEVGVLTDDLKGEIFFSNQLLYDACGAQIVVAVINSTGSYNTEQYSIELFNSWGIGDGERNNGFLLLLAIEDDDYYACPGLGLAEEFSESSLRKLFDEYLEGDFASKQYNEGVKKTFEEVFNQISEIYQTGITVQDGIDAYKTYKENNELKSGENDLSELSMDELVLLQQKITEEIQKRMKR